MERLYLKVVDGVAVTHPVLQSNMWIVENVRMNEEGDWLMPENWYKYEHIEPPELKPFEKNQRPNYILKSGSTDTYTVEYLHDELTDEEKEIEKTKIVKPYPSWVMDENTGICNPPKPYPSDYNNETSNYVWDEPQQEWVKLASD